SSRSTTSRIDFQAVGVVRTSSALVSSSADTPTRSPSISSVTPLAPPRSWLSDIEPLPNPPPLLLPPLDDPIAPIVSPSPPRPESPNWPPPPPTVAGVSPGISEGPSPPPPERRLPPPNTSDRRSARSRARMYLSSYEYRRMPAPALSMRSSQSWMSSR